MGALRKKLNSTRGASILFALLLLVIAAAVSATILSAAVTATTRGVSDRAFTQNRLLLMGVGGQLRECLEETTVTMTATVTRQQEVQNEVEVLSDVYTCGEATCSAEGPLKNTVGEALKTAIRRGVSSSGNRFTVRMSGTALPDSVPEMQVRYDVVADSSSYSLPTRDIDDNDVFRACGRSYSLNGMCLNLTPEEGGEPEQEQALYLRSNISNPIAIDKRYAVVVTGTPSTEPLDEENGINRITTTYTVTGTFTIPKGAVGLYTNDHSGESEEVQEP